MDPHAATVREALRQPKPFASRRQEGLLALWVTSEVLRWRFTGVLASQGDLTPQQYNVLRILRGAGANGLPTLAIVERMIEHTPGITRLLDRLEAKGLVVRGRTEEDRRQVVCRISASGLSTLKRLDPAMVELHEDALGSLSDDEVATLVRLLDKVRTAQP